MAFVSKSFIGDATALDNTETDGRGIDSLSKQVEDYLTSLTPAGSAGAREIKVSCSSLNGDRVFVIVTVET
tara:strand:- start:2204 stop:2416 length:213 start_codon:yes stop_codon:yes gene_type:complete